MTLGRLGLDRTALVLLLLVHVLLGLGRLPGKVVARRIDDVASYREFGAARFLLAGAQLDGAGVYEWLLDHTDEASVILWRWPADGALEFASALLAPRLVVDDRAVPGGADTFAGRPIATGTVPSGGHGQITVQGTGDGGLRLVVR